MKNVKGAVEYVTTGVGEEYALVVVRVDDASVLDDEEQAARVLEHAKIIKRMATEKSILAARKRYAAIASKFDFGGQVTVAEAEKFLGLETDRILLHAQAGKIPSTLRKWGADRTRTYVDARTCNERFGIPTFKRK